MKTWYIILLIFLIGIGLYYLYCKSEEFQLKCIISDVDGKKYCVRDRKNLHLAADRLAEINTRMFKLVEYCNQKYPNKDLVKRLVAGYNPQRIVETLPTSEFTAYSENKGEKIAFCLNKEKNGKKLIDINTLTFVAIHELAHVSCKSIGHTEEFWSNFKFLLVEAKKINVYKPVDYSKNPKKYCGMEIYENPYYDN